jgi:SAM-dependent methyltransferase
MHASAREFVRRSFRSLGPRRFVVEFGSRDVNGGCRDVFGLVRYLGVDKTEGPGVGAVADAAEWSPSGMRPDVVVCVSLLEHAPNAGGIVANAARVLEPGGALILTTVSDPFPEHNEEDGGRLRPGEHYRNIRPEEVATWLSAGFKRFTLEWSGETGDVFALAERGAE